VAHFAWRILRAVAHSFGALALVHHLLQQPDASVAAALLVAPADPDKFGLGAALTAAPLRTAATMVLSQSDPWLSLAAGQRWVARWGCHMMNLGDAGHINVASGHGPWPEGLLMFTRLMQRLQA